MDYLLGPGGAALAERCDHHIRWPEFQRQSRLISLCRKERFGYLSQFGEASGAFCRFGLINDLSLRFFGVCQSA